jgi:hypothetical protein
MPAKTQVAASAAEKGTFRAVPNIASFPISMPAKPIPVQKLESVTGARP